MEIEKDVDFLGLDVKKITKGEREGQVFYILKFICGTDSFECMIFDNPELVDKLKGLQRYQSLILRFNLRQDNNGYLRWNILDAVV